MANKLEFSRAELQAMRHRALVTARHFKSQCHNPPAIDGSADSYVWYQAYDRLVAAADRLDAMLARYDANAETCPASVSSDVPDSPPSGELTDALGST